MRNAKMLLKNAEIEKIREFLRAGESAGTFYQENEMNGEPGLVFADTLNEK